MSPTRAGKIGLPTKRAKIVALASEKSKKNTQHQLNTSHQSASGISASTSRENQKTMVQTTDAEADEHHITTMTGKTTKMMSMENSGGIKVKRTSKAHTK